MLRPLTRSGRPTIRCPNALPPFVNPYRMVHFINVLLGQEEPRVLPGGSLVVQEILDTVYGLAATGREVRPC